MSPASVGFHRWPPPSSQAAFGSSPLSRTAPRSRVRIRRPPPISSRRFHQEARALHLACWALCFGLQDAKGKGLDVLSLPQLVKAEWESPRQRLTFPFLCPPCASSRTTIGIVGLA